MKKKIDVLIPTCDRLTALAITLAGLSGQLFNDFNVVIADQSENYDVKNSKEIQAVKTILESNGNHVAIFKNLPRRGIAEQRQFLLNQTKSPYCLFLDDDLYLENDTLMRMINVLLDEKCGFVGCAPIGLSYRNDVRPHEQAIEFWKERVSPEIIKPGSQQWQRHYLHNAANIYHLQKKLNLSSKNQRTYKIAWIGGCVLYDTKKLNDVGGYSFWKELPKTHCGEDVLVQIRLMEKFGGCGIIPSGVYHLELPTTLIDRSVNAPEIFL